MEEEGKGVISLGKAFVSHDGNRLYTSSHLSLTDHVSKMCMDISLNLKPNKQQKQKHLPTYVSSIFGLFICLFI